MFILHLVKDGEIAPTIVGDNPTQILAFVNSQIDEETKQFKTDSQLSGYSIDFSPTENLFEVLEPKEYLKKVKESYVNNLENCKIKIGGMNGKIKKIKTSFNRSCR